MAEWKKVIVSGSTAALAAANVDGTVTANAFSGDGSNLTNVPAGSINIESFTNGTGITVASTDKLILSDAGTEKYINVSQLPFTTNSFRGIRVTNGETETSLESSEALNITAGTNVSLSESEGVVTITSTDTNTTYSVGDGGLTQKNFTTTLKNKLDGIAASANNYALPLAASGTRGGAKIGYTENGKNYPVELSSEKMYVNVPWSNTTYSVGDGGLTQKNFTTTLKSKLDGIATSANNYSFANSIDGGEGVAVDSGGTQDFRAGTNVTLTQADGGAITIASTDTNTTYSVGAGGLTQENFTTTLKNKLDGIAASANNYSLPEATATVRGGIELFSNTDQSVAANTVSATAGRTYGLQLNSAGQAVVNVPWTNTQSTRGVRTENGETGTALGSSETLTLKAGTNVSISESEGTVTFSSTDTNTTYSVGDGGLTQNNFTNADHSKLNGIAASANNYSLTIADVKSVLGGGMPSNALTIGDTNDTITIAGNLDVNGTTTTIDTTNLAVTDKFIELNRGATTEGDGGIVINGATNKSFGWDDTADRWAFDFTGATAGQTTIDTDAFVAAVAKVKTDVNYQKNGNLHVDGTDIWIYVE
jgi:phage protein U